MEIDLQKLEKNWKNYVDHGILDEQTRPIIQRSWLDCKGKKLDLNEGKGESIDSSQLQVVLDENRELIKVAKPIMQNLYEIVISSHFVLVLTDKNGVLLETIGDEVVSLKASELRFLKGTVWTNDAVGTNAIGIALDEDTAAHVVGAEHYCSAHHKWTCSATTIHNVKGEIIGCLNMSGDSQKLHSHTQGIVVAAGYSIENELALSHAYRSMEASLNSTEDGIFVTDEKLTLQWMNYGAQKVLHINMDEFNSIGFKEIFRKLDIPTENWNHDENTYYYTDVTAHIGNHKIQCSANVSAIWESETIQGYSIGIREIKHLHSAVNRVIGNVASYSFDDIITGNSKMLEVIESAKKMAKTKCSILIEGESGTGKELFAQATHNYSSFSEGPFVAINCASLPKDLLESELFGYEKGAFTGASKEGNPGKFELAEGGTIFLDEIGELPLEVQSKLLRVLDDYKVRRIGGKSEKKLNLRVVAATNRNLLEEVKNKNFRQDLYYRLNVLKIDIPPLRERREDIELSANYFLGKLNGEHNKNVVKKFSPEFISYLKEYNWNGNVRELQNVIERAYYLCDERIITEKYLSENILRKELLNLDVVSLEDTEKGNIIKMIMKCNGNVIEAGKNLNLSKSTIYRKIKKYNINSEIGL